LSNDDNDTGNGNGGGGGGGNYGGVGSLKLPQLSEVGEPG